MESQSTPAGTLFCCRPPLAHRNPGTPATPAAPPSLSLRTRPQPGVAIRPPLAHRNQGTPATPAAPPSLSFRTSAHAGVAIRPPASRRLARPARGAIDLPPMGEGGRQRRPDEGCTRPNLKASLQTPKSPLSPPDEAANHAASAPRPSSDPASPGHLPPCGGRFWVHPPSPPQAADVRAPQGRHDLPPPGEGGRLWRPDEGEAPASTRRPPSKRPSPPCPPGRSCQSRRQCSPTLIRPGFAGPPGIVVSLATGKGSYPMALRACPAGGRFRVHPPSPPQAARLARPAGAQQTFPLRGKVKRFALAVRSPPGAPSPSPRPPL